MIKYSKFTDNIGSGNFTDTFRQNTDKFQKSKGRGVLHPPTPPSRYALECQIRIRMSCIIDNFGYSEERTRASTAVD